MSGGRPSIDELEELLQDEDAPAIEILPDGRVVQVERPAPAEKPLTFRKRLGGEYASLERVEPMDRWWFVEVADILGVTVDELVQG